MPRKWYVRVLVLYEALFPPALQPGWDRLRRRMSLQALQLTAVIIAVGYTVGIVLDLDMMDGDTNLVFLLAVATRYVVIIPALVYVPLMIRFRPKFVFRHLETILIIAIFCGFFGTLLITCPLYLMSLPYGSGEFSIARVLAMWIGIIIMPIRHRVAIFLVIACLLSYLAVSLIMYLVHGYAPYWILVNSGALLGVSLAGLFTSYNRDVAEYRFFKALSKGVRKISASLSTKDATTEQRARVASFTEHVGDEYLEMTMTRTRSQKMMNQGMSQGSLAAIVGFKSLTEAAGHSVRGPAISVPPRMFVGQTVVPEPILESLYKALEQSMKSEIIIPPEYDGTEDERREAVEASRIELMLAGFNESVRRRLWIFREFKDPMSERAFGNELAGRGVRLRSARFSFTTQAVFMMLLGIIEAIFLSDMRRSDYILLIVMRYGITVPVLLLTVGETFLPRKFVNMFHPLIVSIVLPLGTLYQSLRLWLVVGHYGTSMTGTARLYTQSYFCNILRFMMYSSCGVPLRMFWSLLATLLGWIIEISVVYTSTGLSFAQTWGYTFLFPLFIFLLGVHRSLAEEDKSRATFLLNEMITWKTAEDLKNEV